MPHEVKIQLDRFLPRFDVKMARWLQETGICDIRKCQSISPGRLLSQGEFFFMHANEATVAELLIVWERAESYYDQHLKVISVGPDEDPREVWWGKYSYFSKMLGRLFDKSEPFYLRLIPFAFEAIALGRANLDQLPQHVMRNLDDHQIWVLESWKKEVYVAYIYKPNFWDDFSDFPKLNYKRSLAAANSTLSRTEAEKIRLQLIEMRRLQAGQTYKTEQITSRRVGDNEWRMGKKGRFLDQLAGMTILPLLGVNFLYGERFITVYKIVPEGTSNKVKDASL